MGQQQREEQRREDRKACPPTLGIETAVPGYEVKQRNIIIDALWGVVTGDGHYNVRDCGEQK